MPNLGAAGGGRRLGLHLYRKSDRPLPTAEAGAPAALGASPRGRPALRAELLGMDAALRSVLRRSSCSSPGGRSGCGGRPGPRRAGAGRRPGRPAAGAVLPRGRHGAQPQLLRRLRRRPGLLPGAAHPPPGPGARHLHRLGAPCALRARRPGARGASRRSPGSAPGAPCPCCRARTPRAATWRPRARASRARRRPHPESTTRVPLRAGNTHTHSFQNKNMERSAAPPVSWPTPTGSARSCGFCSSRPSATSGSRSSSCSRPSRCRISWSPAWPCASAFPTAAADARGCRRPPGRRDARGASNPGRALGVHRQLWSLAVLLAMLRCLPGPPAPEVGVAIEACSSGGVTAQPVARAAEV